MDLGAALIHQHPKLLGAVGFQGAGGRDLEATSNDVNVELTGLGEMKTKVNDDVFGRGNRHR